MFLLKDHLALNDFLAFLLKDHLALNDSSILIARTYFHSRCQEQEECSLVSVYRGFNEKQAKTVVTIQLRFDGHKTNILHVLVSLFNVKARCEEELVKDTIF